MLYGIYKQSHLITEHGAGFDFFIHSKPTIMNQNQILKTDILDIIFENRNKAYGAYTLRKFYPNRIKYALGLMLIIAIAFATFILLPKEQRDLITRPYSFTEPEFVDIAKDPEIPVKKPEPVKPVANAPIPGIQKLFVTNAVIVPDDVKTEKLNTILAKDLISTVNINVPAAPGPPIVQPVKSDAGSGASEKPAVKTDKAVPMDIDAVDVRPSFPGGMDALKRFLERNLQNPYDWENGETISVKVRFVVGYDGKLQGFVIIEDGGEQYNKEVMRVLKKMPEWIPGKSNGENVPVYYVIPVKFVMSN